MISVERVVMTDWRRMLDHRHDADHMLVVLSGQIVEDGTTYRAGDVRLSNAADRHFLTFAPGTICVVASGHVPSLTCGSRKLLHVGVDDAQRLATCGSSALGDSVERWIAPEVTDQLEDHSSVPPWLAEFEDVRLAGRLVSTRSIDVAARMAGVSREHLSRSYRRHFGTSVTASIKARRLHSAWDAVTRSSMTLAEIADASGFADQSHMTRHFTEWIGLAPAAVRRAAHEVTRLQDGTLALGV